MDGQPWGLMFANSKETGWTGSVEFGVSEKGAGVRVLGTFTSTRAVGHPVFFNPLLTPDCAVMHRKLQEGSFLETPGGGPGSG